MTFNDNADVRGSGAKRRGPSGGVIASGVGGLGIVAVIVLSLVTGGDFSSLLGGLAGDTTTSDSGSVGTELEGCETGADANAKDDCRLAAGSLAINQFWAQQIDGYPEPQLIIVDGSTSTACGTASQATGPFYCPPEETVYVDPTFFDLMRQQFGADVGELGQLYVLAHEYGHHVQQITGVFDTYPQNGTGPTSNGVRTELQADCYAGAWIANAVTSNDENGVAYLRDVTDQQLRDAQGAATAVGDDRIQAQSGVVNPESWTHGSSAQRERWLMVGYQYGVGACDTFAAGEEL